jgi:hypothetical protein
MNNKLVKAAAGVVLFIIGFIALCMWGLPQYKVYSQTMRGTAAFKEAEIDRQILVEEARAQEEALTMKANGEAAREKIKAEATAVAIKQIGAELQSNPSYLQWLWVNEVAGGTGEKIYIPTEGMLPAFLEAGGGIRK